MATAEFLAPPKPAPPLNIPASSSTVDVRVIDSTCRIVGKMDTFFTECVEKDSMLDTPAYVFLVSHGPTKTHYLFDLGVRKDLENYAPPVAEFLSTGTFEITSTHTIPEILENDTSGLNIKPQNINGVIWSHQHFDHIGNMSEFPPSTEVIVGPGFTAKHLPTYPTNPDSELQESDLAGRLLRELDMDDPKKGCLTLGRCRAFDFFGDGSFYLLETNGHTIGHLAGLARTTAAPASFVLMGGDICTNCGEMRPTAYLPLPTRIAPSPVECFRGWCPGEALRAIHPRHSATEPFFETSDEMNDDNEEARRTIGKMVEFDAAENVFTVLAHDRSVLEHLVYFPEKLNDWREKRIKEDTRWGWAAVLKRSLAAQKAITDYRP